MPFVEVNGEIRPLDGPGVSKGGIILARGRCLFGRLDVPSGAGRHAVGAAKLHAKTAAPYPASSCVIVRQGNTFGFWWWDAAWISDVLSRAGLSPTTRILPEPFLQPSAEGWRIVKTSEGFDAQLWKDHFLVSSLWRRNPFDAESWFAFARSDISFSEAAPSMPPALTWPNLTWSSDYRRKIVKINADQNRIRLAAAALGACAAVLLLFVVGRTLGLESETRRLQAVTAALRAVAPPRREEAAMRRLGQLGSTVTRPDPVATLEAVRSTLSASGYPVLGFTADHKTARVILPSDAAPAIGPIVEALEQSLYFRNAKPKLDSPNKHLIIDMDVRALR